MSAAAGVNKAGQVFQKNEVLPSGDDQFLSTARIRLRLLRFFDESLNERKINVG
jgi:hypothetical protein